MVIVIAAYAENRVIGYQGTIPWHIPKDLRRFKDLSMGKTLIMGRKTFEDIGHPLPGRKTIILSSRPVYESEICHTCRSLEEAIQYAGDEDIVIAGGQRVYADALPYADILYLTEVDLNTPGDTFFPEFNPDDFILTEQEEIAGDPACRFLTYKRK